jgi:argininosuccinate lyase
MKAWEGRFTGKANPLMEKFSASIDTDRFLYEYDIEGSKAHAEMLKSIGILTEREKRLILKALDEIKVEIAGGKFPFSPEKEDIHMHIEARLIEKIGETGGKLHTGRSRNDQVSLDMRMFLKKEFEEIDKQILALLRTFLNKAEAEKRTIMPGYTHLQRAQVITLSHFLMAYYHMLKRDREKMSNLKKWCDVMPLGSGALAGSTIPLDREYVRRRLGFTKVSENSIDSVSERDFVLDALYLMSLIMVHLSRLSEDLILFATEEFSFISLPDEMCTGSSLMPHKKNPDALELIRGKASRVMGDLFSLLSLLKGLPLSYNRDLQEDKEPLFHGIQTVKESLSIMALCIEGIKVYRENMERAVYGSYMPAVEMAEYLALKGMPFRNAHTIVGNMVKHCENKKQSLWKMPLAQMKRFSSLFDNDIFKYIEPKAILQNRKTKGAASFREIERTINAEKRYLGF